MSHLTSIRNSLYSFLTKPPYTEFLHFTEIDSVKYVWNSNLHGVSEKSISRKVSYVLSYTLKLMVSLANDRTINPLNASANLLVEPSMNVKPRCLLS